MIRKVVIVVLTVLAVATLVVSHSSPLSLVLADSDSELSMLLLGDGQFEMREIRSQAIRSMPGAFFSFGAHKRQWLKETRPIFPNGRLFYHETTSYLVNQGVTGFPLWAPFILFAAYPTLAFIRGPVRRWRRRKRGLCIHCGYNLTGLTEPRCPECGQAI